MSIVDVKRRHTDDWARYTSCLRSSDSLIFFSPLPHFDNVAFVEFSVGDRAFDTRQRKFYSIPDEGLRVSPNSGVVIETEETVALPHNVVGSLTGKGQFIFNAGFLSPGKIDPGFQGKLRIGFYNASHAPVVFQPGEQFCSCCFLNMESEEPSAKRQKEIEPPPETREAPWHKKLLTFFVTNWSSVFSVLFGFIAIVVSILVALFK